VTRPLNSDPLRNFRFLCTISHPKIPTIARMGFMAISGLAVQNEVIPYREGGNNTTTRKMPGQSDFGPISLTRGAMASPVMTGGASGQGIGTNEAFTWLTQIFSVQAGAGFGGPDTDFRVPVTIDVLQHPITVPPYAAGIDNPPAIKARFQVFNAWPMGLSYSDLEAGGNAVFIENLTLANEGWALFMATNNPNDFLTTSAGFTG
jgi:phage tail-like protein